MSNFFKRIILYLSIGVILTMIPLYYMNNILFSSASPTSTADQENKVSYKLKSSLPAAAAHPYFLYDHQHISYVENGILNIKDLSSDAVVKQLQEDDPIIYAFPLNDRNIIIYFTYDDSQIDIKNYNFDKDEKADQLSINVKNVSKIKHAKYSSLTNLLYLDVETSVNNKTSDKIYKVTIMKNLYPFANNDNIVAMELLSNKDLLIYQDELGNVMINGQAFRHENYTKFKLLGIDGSDTVYLAPVNNPLEVIMLKDDNVLGSKQLTDVNYISTLSQGDHVYLIYKNHVLDLVSGSDYPIDEDIQVLDLYNGYLFYETADRQLKAEKLS
ncbi:hypothetical protein Sgly_3069 [Syntrophobotulus glycolicus DSM 8271]|uniref:Uncharacterized protein n=1 Tax=Syntrophobotulus glycolicus (strain DSM 8271 / FlGlyR) TaxID=645991 RepID=F0T0G5_SYNGF|nr:hypothetical protein [Syntrophobotulus glycolicus]ADY57337.1 hypothetical protein Sgly_3069 [Syntrophobotulus glycolicus DSM 8271]